MVIVSSKVVKTQMDLTDMNKTSVITVKDILIWTIKKDSKKFTK